jgi:hypothetical protein
MLYSRILSAKLPIGAHIDDTVEYDMREPCADIAANL